MGDDEGADRRVGQVGGHRQLDDGKKLSDAYAEGGEAEDAVVIGAMRTFMKPRVSESVLGAEIGEPWGSCLNGRG